jgi:Protein of unknown function (DUF3800)
MALARISQIVPHLCGFPFRVRERRVLLMLSLRAFIDESGTETRGPREIFTMGGWVADVKTWERFSEDWDATLRKPPSIAYFKHNEAKAKDGEFEGWNEVEIDRKVFSLAEVVDRHIHPKNGSYGVLTGIKAEVLRILLSRSPATRRQIRSVLKMTTPYDFCFHSIAGIVLTHQYLTLKNDQGVDFIFDENPSFEACEKMYRKLKKLMPPGVRAIAGTATELNDKQVAPLQAADLLVGQVTANIRSGKPEKPFQLFNSVPRRVLFSPIRWGEDAVLAGFAKLIGVFNVDWSNLMIEQASTKK